MSKGTFVLAAPLWLIVANTSDSHLVAMVASIAALTHAIAGILPTPVFDREGGTR